MFKLYATFMDLLDVSKKTPLLAFANRTGASIYKGRQFSLIAPSECQANVSSFALLAQEKKHFKINR